MRLTALPSDEGEELGHDGIAADAVALRRLADDPAPFLCKLLHIFLPRAWTRLVCDRLGGSTARALHRAARPKPSLAAYLTSAASKET